MSHRELNQEQGSSKPHILGFTVPTHEASLCLKSDALEESQLKQGDRIYSTFFSCSWGNKTSHFWSGFLPIVVEEKIPGSSCSFD